MKNSNVLKNFIFLSFLLSIALLSSCRKDSNSGSNQNSSLASSYTADVPLSWNELMLEIDRFSPGYRPPAAARMFAYMGLAAYEAAVPGMPDYQSLAVQFPQMSLPKIETGKDYHWPSAVNAVYASMFRYFYPHIKPADLLKIDQLEAKFVIRFEQDEDDAVIKRSRDFGKAVADAVYRYSATDIAGHEAYKNPRPSSYVPPAVGPNGEKLWQPTFPDYTRALFPYWGQVRPFAMKDSELRARPPLPYSEDPNSKFYQQAKETYLIVKEANFEDRWIAEFWSDDIFELTFEPAARQIAIANQLADQKNISLDKAVELYAKMGMAMCDAAIAVWNSKYIYNVIRPIDYIRRFIDPSWTTLLNVPFNNVKSITPEFPAYPSGHACFGGSGAGIMNDIFGGTTSFTDNCHVSRFEFIGAPRYFNSFTEAATENAISRLPLGVHFRMDADEGLRLGLLAAKRVVDLPWKK